MIMHISTPDLSEEHTVADADFEKLVQQFAERHREDDAAHPVDWEEMKRWWVTKVHELFDQIDGWLRPLTESGAVQSSRGRTLLTEEDLGHYEIESLQLQVASRSLRFEPVGTMLIGAFGRIEVQGPNGSAVLLLLSTVTDGSPGQRRSNVHWFISHPADPRPRTRANLRPLTQDSFQQLFTDLFGISR